MVDVLAAPTADIGGAVGDMWRSVLLFLPKAVAFIAIVVSNLTLIFVSRSRSESLATIFFKTNRIYWSIAALALVALAVIICVPSVATVFAFAAPPPAAVLSAVAAALSSVLICGWMLRSR